MKELKFRAWDKAQKKMRFITGFCFWSNNQFIELQFGEHGFSKHETKDIQLMQYSGLNDRNGNDIYEGDIVTFGCTVASSEYYSRSEGDWRQRDGVRTEEGFIGDVYYCDKSHEWRIRNIKFLKGLQDEKYVQSMLHHSKTELEWAFAVKDRKITRCEINEIVGNVYDSRQLLDNVAAIA